MAIANSEIAGLLERMADLLEIEEANPFRVRAYRNAARTIAGLPRSVAAMVEAGDDLSKLPTIGKDLAQKIEQMVETGSLPALTEIERHTPGGLVTLLNLPGLGPKRVHALRDRLGIEDLETLAAAARAGKIHRLPGFSIKTEQNILRALQTRGPGAERRKRALVQELAEDLVARLARVEGVKEVVIAGSYRRRLETVGDIDILVTCASKSPVMAHFTGYERVAEVVSSGTTRSTVILHDGLQVDLRVVPEDSYGAALHYFTGSKAHNIAVRRMAQERGLKINEYGVFRGEQRIAGRSEDEVFGQVDLPFIEPELRENRGEIEAAQAGRLPRLVTLDDIRGDLHLHSKASDGHNTIEEMARAARAAGYRYISINDHSKRVTIAHGLDERRLAQQLDEIDALNARLKGICVLKSSEVDILEDGSLDLPDSILARLDLTVCAIHSRFALDRDTQTERVIRAMDNPHFTILAHPTGRLINQRPPYELDMERLLKAARGRGCFLEVNAQPDRLDLTDLHCHLAKEAGVKVAISTDAHSVFDLAFMRFGVDQARRGWLEPDDVLNTRPLPQLRKLLKRY